MIKYKPLLKYSGGWTRLKTKIDGDEADFSGIKVTLNEEEATTLRSLLKKLKQSNPKTEYLTRRRAPDANLYHLEVTAPPTLALSVKGVINNKSIPQELVEIHRLVATVSMRVPRIQST